MCDVQISQEQNANQSTVKNKKVNEKCARKSFKVEIIYKWKLNLLLFHQRGGQESSLAHLWRRSYVMCKCMYVKIWWKWLRCLFQILIWDALLRGESHIRMKRKENWFQLSHMVTCVSYSVFHLESVCKLIFFSRSQYISFFFTSLESL